MFHNRPIPPYYVRMKLEDIIVNLHFMILVEKAEQSNLNDDIGLSMLWFKGLTILRK